MVNSLFNEAIGFYNISIASFFVLEINEVVTILERMRDRIRYEHQLQYVAIKNALGGAFAKNYKYVDVFEKENSKKEVTQEEREEAEAYFESW